MLEQVQWELMEDDEDLDGHGNLLPNQGIVLTVCHLPDMRATMMPLLSQDEVKCKAWCMMGLISLLGH